MDRSSAPSSCARVGDLLIVFDINPVLQPLFVGVVLLLAVCIGSLRLLRIKNKVDLYR